MASVDHVVTARVELDNAVVVRPGDTLIVGLSGRLDMTTADTIKRRLTERLPGIEAVLIDACAGLAVYRPDEDAAAPEARSAAERKAARIRGERP